jgi:ribosome maturation factor RimP
VGPRPILFCFAETVGSAVGSGCRRRPDVFAEWSRMNALADRVAALIEPSLTAMGYDLVRVLIDGKRQARVQIMAERSDGSGMGVEDCAQISRTISALLDVEDPIEGAYALEVSSPGLDRPLMKAADYQRFAGNEARIEMKAPHDGRRRFTGTLKGLAGEAVLLDLGPETVALPLAAIDRAKLILTEALLKSAPPSPLNKEAS